MNTEFVGNVVISGTVGNPHHKLNLGSDQPRSPGTEGTFTVCNNTFVMSLASSENHMIRVGGKVKEALFFNNVFVGPKVPEFRVLVIEDVNAEGGKPGSEGRLQRLEGGNNFVAANCVSIPEEFKDTVRAGDAGFTSFDANDFAPAAGSPLIGAGSSKAPMAAHFSPQRKKIIAGEELRRPSGVKMDIGAFGMTIESIPDGPGK